MREIKFRVWGLVAGDFMMLPVSQLSWDEHDDGVLRLHFCGCLDERMQGSFGVHSGLGNVDGSEDTGWVLMQYTGLLDKQGKEIYEGDILRWEGEEIFIDAVSWHDEYAEWWVNGISLWEELKGEVKVIGNIYENKELLE